MDHKKCKKRGLEKKRKLKCVPSDFDLGLCLFIYLMRIGFVCFYKLLFVNFSILARCGKLSRSPISFLAYVTYMYLCFMLYTQQQRCLKHTVMHSILKHIYQAL